MNRLLTLVTLLISQSAFSAKTCTYYGDVLHVKTTGSKLVELYFKNYLVSARKGKFKLGNASGYCTPFSPNVDASREPNAMNRFPFEDLNDPFVKPTLHLSVRDATYQTRYEDMPELFAWDDPLDQYPYGPCTHYADFKPGWLQECVRLNLKSERAKVEVLITRVCGKK